jgi:hypothetical protein
MNTIRTEKTVTAMRIRGSPVRAARQIAAAKRRPSHRSQGCPSPKDMRVYSSMPRRTTARIRRKKRISPPNRTRANRIGTATIAVSQRCKCELAMTPPVC